MIRQCPVGCLALLLLRSLAPAQPATAPAPAPATQEDPVAAKQAQHREVLREVEKLPAVTLPSLDKAVRFSIEADMLAANTEVKATDGPVRLMIPDVPGVLTMQLFRDEPGPDGSQLFMFQQRDFSPPGSQFYYTSVQVIGGRVIVARDGESGQGISSIQLVQDPPPPPGQPMPEEGPVRLLVRKTNAISGRDEVDLKLSAASFVELRREHAGEVDTYLRPLFRDLRQEGVVFGVDSKAGWQVLAPGFEPDDATRQQVQAALAQFDADDFQQREGALQALQKLGQPAAILLMRMDRSKLSPEAQNGVETFLAPYMPMDPRDAEQRRNDPQFLLDTLYSDDAQLRKLAAEQLAKVTGRRLEFDPDADADKRREQIQALRAAIGSPATAPERG